MGVSQGKDPNGPTCALISDEADVCHRVMPRMPRGARCRICVRPRRVDCVTQPASQPPASQPPASNACVRQLIAVSSSGLAAWGRARWGRTPSFLHMSSSPTSSSSFSPSHSSHSSHSSYTTTSFRLAGCPSTLYHGSSRLLPPHCRCQAHAAAPARPLAQGLPQRGVFPLVNWTLAELS